MSTMSDGDNVKKVAEKPRTKVVIREMGMRTYSEDESWLGYLHDGLGVDLWRVRDARVNVYTFDLAEHL